MAKPAALQQPAPELGASDSGASAAAPEAAAGPTYLDVAPLLARASGAMAPGDLLHADAFSLFESITAVEIGALPLAAARLS